MDSLIYMFIDYLKSDLISLAIIYVALLSFFFSRLYFPFKEDFIECILWSISGSLILLVLMNIILFSGDFIIGRTEIINEKELNQVMSIKAAMQTDSYTPDQKAVINKVIELSSKNGKMYKYEFDFLNKKFQNFQKENSDKLFTEKIQTHL